MVRFFITLLFFLPAAQAEARLAGPYPAEVLRVIDGDSFEARVRIWLDQDVTVTVRLAGIDAAELSAPCPAARMMARLARAMLAARLAPGGVVLSEVDRDKYGGRVLARVRDAAGADVAAALAAAGLARLYAGRRADWCASGDAGEIRASNTPPS